MPSFQDSIFLFVLALLLFGPKRLPVLARELGKWVGEFRRASNEFKMQMEEELRLSEQDDRQKKIAAMEAAAPVAPPLEEPAQPLLRAAESGDDALSANADTEYSNLSYEDEGSYEHTHDPDSSAATWESAAAENWESSAAEKWEPTTQPSARTNEPTTVLPIATSGELRLMPPATGLPTAQHAARDAANPLGGLLDAIPARHNSPVARDGADDSRALAASPTEAAAHGH